MFQYLHIVAPFFTGGTISMMALYYSIPRKRNIRNIRNKRNAQAAPEYYGSKNKQAQESAPFSRLRGICYSEASIYPLKRSK
jgi:hypothetical protein